MSILLGNIDSELLQKKFFNLVVQPAQSSNFPKPTAKPSKPVKKLERRYARHFDR